MEGVWEGMCGLELRTRSLEKEVAWEF